MQGTARLALVPSWLADLRPERFRGASRRGDAVAAVEQDELAKVSGHAKKRLQEEHSDG
jgi:hypothetical protein